VDVNEIKETQILQQETIQRLTEAVERNIITKEELIASDKYQRYAQEIDNLKAEIESTVSQIKGVENAIKPVDENTKAILQQNITNLENQLIDKNRELEKKENGFDHFVRDLLQLAKQLSETGGIDSERLEKARELFKEGKYEEVLEVLDEKQI